MIYHTYWCILNSGTLVHITMGNTLVKKPPLKPLAT